MYGLTMDYQLTVPALLRRVESHFGNVELVDRHPDGSYSRTTYGDVASRARQLAAALERWGIRRGDRVATFCWNSSTHLEAYLGVPSGGFVLHPLNPRLHADDLAYIASHAQDRVLIADRAAQPLIEQFLDRTSIEEVFYIEDSYQELLATASPEEWVDPQLDEREAGTMSYTTGTTGAPKGVVHSHRALMLHTLGLGTCLGSAVGINRNDVLMPGVSMYHGNGWGLPYLASMLGIKTVFTGPRLDPHTMLEASVLEGVTVSSGVPTIWLGIIDELDSHPERWDLSQLRTVLSGGAPVPRCMVTGLANHGVGVCQIWGMTELTCGTAVDLPLDVLEGDEDARFDAEAEQGISLPMVEIRGRDDDGNLIPWDGTAIGELEVRGPWVAGSYYDAPETAASWTEDGWFKTGDVVCIHPSGSMQVVDRTKDLIKSGGLWISSVALENQLMAHPNVVEAAVIAEPHDKWGERPVAVVVLAEGRKVSPSDLRDFIAPHFPRWCLPDRFEFVEELPKTGVGKFLKRTLREQFATA